MRGLPGLNLVRDIGGRELMCFDDSPLHFDTQNDNIDCRSGKQVGASSLAAACLHDGCPGRRGILTSELTPPAGRSLRFNWGFDAGTISGLCC
jgi:hypothetical protein